LRCDRQVILTKDLNDDALKAIRDAQPSERSKAIGRDIMDDTATG
jgi:hypothetical protein